MKRAILTVGPQCVGKTTFCQRAVKIYPEIILISLDDILKEMFATGWSGPYTENHTRGLAVAWRRVSEALEEDGTLLFDTWVDPTRMNTKFLVKNLRDRGAEEVYGWYFVTPLDVCLGWFCTRELGNIQNKQKQDIIRTMREDDYARFYGEYHEACRTLADQDFNRLPRVNPLQTSPQDLMTWI